MALGKRTIIDQIEIRRDGTVRVRLAKQVVEDDVVVAQEYHRLPELPPGGEIDPVLAVIDDHLESVNAARVDAGEWSAFRDVIAAVHTPERIAAFRQRESKAAPPA